MWMLLATSSRRNRSSPAARTPGHELHRQVHGRDDHRRPAVDRQPLLLQDHARSRLSLRARPVRAAGGSRPRARHDRLARLLDRLRGARRASRILFGGGGGGAFTSRLSKLKEGDEILVERKSYGFLTTNRFE